MKRKKASAGHCQSLSQCDQIWGRLLTVMGDYVSHAKVAQIIATHLGNFLKNCEMEV